MFSEPTAYWWVTGCCGSLPATPPPHSPHCLHRHQVTTATRLLSHLPIRSPTDSGTAPLLAAPTSALLRYFATDTHSPALGANASCLPPLPRCPAAPPPFTGRWPASLPPAPLRLYPCANAWSLNCALLPGVNQDPSPFDLDRVTVILATPLDHSADHAQRSAHARPPPLATPTGGSVGELTDQPHQSSPSVNLVRDLHIGKLTRPTPPTTPDKTG